jgi:hypothetical protein
MSAAGFVSRLEIFYQEINFGPRAVGHLEQFSGMGNFLAPVCLSNDGLLMKQTQKPV